MQLTLSSTVRNWIRENSNGVSPARFILKTLEHCALNDIVPTLGERNQDERNGVSSRGERTPANEEAGK